MSKIGNGAIRSKNARETYVEQLAQGRGITAAMNRKRQIFTGINPTDDVDLAYRSTSNYLRQLAQQGSIPSDEMLIAGNVPRTRSASELTMRNNLTRSINGNPKYKAQEDYYEEIQSMKKDMKAIRDENSNLRAKIRRLEEDNTRKRKEIDTLYDSNKDGDLRRTLAGSTTDRSNTIANTNNAANVVMSLKQRLFKLESQLKQKETVADELRSDPRWTKGTELEIQNRALLGEIERLKFTMRGGDNPSLTEEMKERIRKLTKENDQLKEENTSLKKKIGGTHNPVVIAPFTAPFSVVNPSVEDDEEFKRMKHELAQANQRLEQMQTELEETREKLRQADANVAKAKHETAQQANAEIEKIKQNQNVLQEKFNRISDELEEVKRDRDQCKKRLDQTNVELEKTKNDRDQYQRELNAANEEIKRLKISKPISPPLSVHQKRSASPSSELAVGLKTTAASRDTSFSDEPNSKDNESSRNVNQESALKTVQAFLRGHLARNEMNKPQDSPASKPTPPNSGSESPKQSRPSSPPTPFGTGTAVTTSLYRPETESPPGNQASKRDPDSFSKARPSSATPKKRTTPRASSSALPDSPPSDNPLPAPRKSPVDSKQSVKAPVEDDDDDDIVAT